MAATGTAAATTEALPPWPQAAAPSETRFRFRGEGTLSANKKPSDQPCTVRLRGRLVLSHASRRVGPRGRPVDVTNQVVRKLDIQFKITDHAVFQCSKVCGELIRDMLATAVAATNESEYKLPADAADSSQTPVDLAAVIVESTGREIDEIVAAGGVVPGYDLCFEIPQVCITLVYEPKALLLACEEATAAKTTEAATGVVALCGRKRRREPSDLCAVCLLDMEAEDDRENVRLPCSHTFHAPCIEPWFQRASSCPTCRRDIMECFSFVTSAPPRSQISPSRR